MTSAGCETSASAFVDFQGLIGNLKVLTLAAESVAPVFDIAA